MFAFSLSFFALLWRWGHLLEGGRVDDDSLDLDEHSKGELGDLQLQTSQYLLRDDGEMGRTWTVDRAGV